MIAENEAKISLEAFKVNNAGEEINVPNSSFIKAMRKPNEQQSQFRFLEFHFTYMKLVGECFWYLVPGERTGRVMEMHLLPPDMMDVVVDKNDPRGLVAGYVLNKPDGTKVPFEFDEVFHSKLPNVFDPYRGYSAVQAGKVYIETEEFGSKWTRSALLNSGRPSGILKIKSRISKPQFEKIKRQWINNNTSPENAGKTLFVKGDGDVDWIKMGMELQEIALKELKDMSTDDLLFMYRVNRAAMGITDDVNRANAHEARVFLNENIIKPDWDRFIDDINQFVIPKFEQDTFVKYKKPTLKSDAERLEEDKALVDKVKSRNEIREERGLEPVEGGGFLYVAVNQIPIGTTPDGQKMLKKKVSLIGKGENSLESSSTEDK
jgi:HK97 family phage portal protein